MRYIPNTPLIRQQMLDQMGVPSVDSLFTSVPEPLRLQGLMDIPLGMSELEELRYFQKLADENRGASYLSFLGGGSYDHFIPLVSDSLVSRGEFLTSYTPYQPEVSQGTLQAVFEFQSFICLLTGMEVANASVYDGAMALAEGVLMSLRIQKNRNKILVPTSLHPHYVEVLKTYTNALSIEWIPVPVNTESGQIDSVLLSLLLDEKVACLVVQQPNFYGVIESMDTLTNQAKKVGALTISVITEALSLAVLDTPGSAGVDIVVGEAQSFGVPVSFGGPYLGFMATLDVYKRNLPGRIVGRTVDTDGNPGFVITLATREQHIRRERATSNICTNQNLVMLMAVMYLTIMGQLGLKKTAHHNVSKMAYFKSKLKQLPGYQMAFSGDVFNEVVVRCPVSASEITLVCQAQEIIPGIDLGKYDPHYSNNLLIAITETKKREDIDMLIDQLAKFC